MSELFQVPIEETVAPQPVAEVNPAPEAAAPSALIDIIEPPAPVVETAAQRAERLHSEDNERRKREFTLAVLEARKPEQPKPVAQPVAPGMTERTAKEMAEGARMNAVHEANKANRPAQVPSAREKQAQGSTVPVFRPADYVPDPVKGTGNVTATSV